jgi:hypothetical protein
MKLKNFSESHFFFKKRHDSSHALDEVVRASNVEPVLPASVECPAYRVRGYVWADIIGTCFAKK